jgi:hypothetical protein
VLSLFEQFSKRVDESVLRNPCCHLWSPGEVCCFLWTGAKGRRGYGQLCDPSNRRTQLRAHRVSYELAYGEFEARLYVCHRCDNPSCVNPKHLFLGTQTDNMRDAAAKGRMVCGSRLHPEMMRRGEQHGRHKLTEEDVVSIRGLNASGMSQRKLAKIYGVSLPSVQDVIHRITWKHV